MNLKANRSFYSGNYFIYLTGYILFCFVYVCVTKGVMQDKPSIIIGTLPFILFSAFGLFYFLKLRFTPILVVEKDRIDVFVFGKGYRSFLIKETEIEIFSDVIKFKDSSGEILFNRRIVWIQAWDKAANFLSGFENKNDGDAKSKESKSS